MLGYFIVVVLVHNVRVYICVKGSLVTSHILGFGVSSCIYSPLGISQYI